jgi:probable HAF family extracellular repeat protein
VPTVATRRAVLPDAPAADVRSQGSPQTWTTTVLGTLPGHVFSIAYDISDNGTVVGYSQSSTSGLLPFYWTQAGGMKQLAVPIHASEGVARAISDNGAYVTGEVKLGDGRLVPARWRWSGGKSVVALIGCHSGRGYSGSGLGVNNAGTVVGSANSAAWSWPLGSSCGSPITIQGTPMSHAYGINDLGTIVGAGWSPRRGFVKTVSLAAQLQPSPGDGAAWAHAVNDANEVVGRSNTGTSGAHGAPVYWNAGAGPPALVLAPSFFLYGFVQLSDKGRIVWQTATGGMSRKGTTTWALSIWPNGVNACGDIVGMSTNGAVRMKKLACD